jgi:hypothetical protein
MGAHTKVSICSSALNLLGEREIASLEEDTDAARICAQLYDTVKWALLSEFDWSFSKKKVQLPRIVEAPLSAWRYQFQLPPDRIADVFALFTSAGTYERPFTFFEIHGSRLLANEPALWLDYQYNVAEADMPPYFVRLFTYDLAADFAMPVTEQRETGAYWHEVARGSPSENGRGGYFRVAANADSRGRPSNKAILADDLVAVRMG